MTLTKDIAAKFAIAFVAVAMIFSAYAPAASAQTTEDLQQMINDLLAQVAQLQASTGQGATSVASGVCPYTWTRSLTMGSEGADVMKLQQFLNANVDTRVAASGAGSVGAETMYYGPATAAAVSKMQVMYRADVLTPAGLVNPTGYFGPSTMAKANSLCVASTGGDDMGGDDMGGDDMDDSNDNGSVTLQGEASLDSFEIDSASDSDIAEGKDDQEVAELTVEFEDGDAEISRIDVKFAQVGAEAADAFETISLWVDGDKVAEKDADDEDDYQSDEQTMRFSGLDIIAMEDEEVEIVVAVSTQSNLDADELGQWTVSVESMRFFDADGVATTDDSTDDIGSGSETFTIEVAGADDEIIAKTSSNDPDATTLPVEDDSKSDWYSIFVFDLDTDDSVNDIEINTLVLNVETAEATNAADAGYDDLVDDVEVVIDGVTIDDVTVGGTSLTAGVATLTFDVDGDVVIDAGDRVEVELMVRFKSLLAAEEGATIMASISSLDDTIIDAEGAEDIEDSQLSGAASGDTHTLRTTGISTAKTDSSAVVTTGPNEATADDYTTYELEIEVTAFEQDAFIAVDPSVSIDYALVDGAGSAAVAGTQSVVLTSSADEGGAGDAFFEINEGETETITLTVTYTPGVAGTQARLRLNSIDFDATGTAGTGDDSTQTTLPATDYRTAVTTMTN